MATEKDFRVKSSLQAPTSVKVGSAEITSSGTDMIFPAGIQTSGVGVPQITSASSVTITAPDGINLNGSSLATESYVNTQVSNVSVDLTGYATETYVNNTVANYLTISSFNTQISSYALTTDVNNALALKANTSSLAAIATSGNYNDLSNTPTIPSLTGYATESWVTSQGYITSETDSQTLSFANNQITISNGNTIDVSSLYQDLTGYATETYVDNETQWADTQTTHVIQYNAQTVTQDVTIASTQNAFSAGPIEIQAGTAVTIDDGGVWIIL